MSLKAGNEVKAAFDKWRADYFGTRPMRVMRQEAALLFAEHYACLQREADAQMADAAALAEATGAYTGIAKAVALAIREQRMGDHFKAGKP